ncbi:MAG: NBR1-Ig-like domain-containing protein [Brevefilum sp.]|jgi:hypothetical protein
MMKFWLSNIFMCVIVTAILSGCAPALSVDTEPTATVIQSSSTPFSTVTPQPATVTPFPSSTAASAPPIAQAPSGQRDGFVFVGETIPDGTNIQPGQAFQKTWTIMNGSSSDWDKGFSLTMTSTYPGSESLGSPEHIPLAQEVKPGETIEIKVDLVAPQQDGEYTVFYELWDVAGLSVLNSQIWVTITVGIAPISSSSGVSAQVLSAFMENSEYTVYFCMQLPDGRQWYPENVLLLVNHQQYAPVASRIDPIGATTANKCFNFSFPVTISSKTAYQLSIGKVELPPQVHQDENCARAQTLLRAAYPGLDFNCAGPGFWYTHLVLPAGMTEEQADQLILDAMSSSIYGPWVLNGIAP